MMSRLNSAIVIVFYAAFGLLGIVLAVEGRFLCLGVCFATAALGFLFVSWLRKAIGAPRPYQKDGSAPRIPRDGVDDSFPSRHCYSATMISLCWGLAGFPVVCAVLFTLSCALGLLRVKAGVHYPKDVLAAMGLAMAFALFAGALLWLLG